MENRLSAIYSKFGICLDPFFLVDYFRHIEFDSIGVELSILYFTGLPVKISLTWYISIPEDCFYLADPDGTPYAAFHLGLYYLPKYLFRAIPEKST